MFKLILSCTGDSRTESLSIPNLSLALKAYTQWLDYYGEIKRRVGVTGDYKLSLLTPYDELIKSELI